MKAYTNIPRDFTRVKEKILFNLTKRQIICFGLAAAVGFPAYFAVKELADSTTASFVMIFLMLPLFLFALYEKHGQPLEVHLLHLVQTKLLRTKKRVYQTEQQYEAAKKKALQSKRGFRVRIREKLTQDSPKTAQQSIPYEKMYPDGVCRVRADYYSMSIRFFDRGYQLLNQDQKEQMLDEWGNFLKLFGSDVHFQLSYLNLPEDMDGLRKKLKIPARGDHLDHLRKEHAQVLEKHVMRGKKGYAGDRILSFGVEAQSLADARTKLSHMEGMVLAEFEKMGVRAVTLKGEHRLKVMYRIFHTERNFSWNVQRCPGASSKDLIAPKSFRFGERSVFQIGSRYGAVSYVAIQASELDDETLKEFLDGESCQITSMHIETVEQAKAVKLVKRIISEIDRSKIEEQKKAVRSGYDMDLIPTDLSTYGQDARKLLRGLQSEDERMFLITMLIVTMGNTKEELERNVSRLSRIIQQKNCEFWRLDYQQEQGLMSSLPLAQNLIEIKRALTTSSTAIFIPFTEPELFEEGEGGIYYGVDQITKNLIVADKKRLKCPNALILGSSGSGKSFKAKEEMTSVILSTMDDVVICDPEAEYRPLVEMLQGQVIKISAGSHDYINPLDIHKNYSDEDDPLTLKTEFVMSFFELILEGTEGIRPEERTIIDRCIPRVYEKYFKDPVPENMPVLEDLYEELKRQQEPDAYRVTTALEMYVKGSLRVFNHRTNVDLNNRMVCFDIKDLGKQMKKLGMLIVQDHIWGRVSANREKGKSTRYYADEFHLLLKDPQTASYAVEIWKRFRKHGGICTGITQDIKDLLKSYEIENIIENSDFIIMLNQGSGDRNILADRLEISTEQLKYVTGAKEGTGLIAYGNEIIPFEDNYPKDTQMYRTMTTKLSEVTAQ